MDVKTTIVLALCPAESILEYCRVCQDPGSIVFMRRERNICSLPGDCRVVTFGDKRISWRSFALLRAIGRYAPEKVVVVCGKAFWHQNVLDALFFLRKVRRISFEVSFVVDGAEPVSVTDPKPQYYFNPLIMALGALSGLCLLALLALWSVDALVGVLSGLAAAELLMRYILRVKHIEYRATDAAPGKNFAGHENMLAFHPLLGWFNRPNNSTTVTVSLAGVQRSLAYGVSTDARGCRVIGAATGETGGRKVMVTGASAVFGDCVEDAEAFPSVLQLMLKECRVSNYGCASYTSYQQLLLLEEVIKEEKPSMLVFVFNMRCDFGLITGNPENIRSFGMPLPTCVSVNGKLKRYAPDTYRKLFYSERICLLAALEHFCNSLIFRIKTRSGERNRRKIFIDTIQHVILQMRKTCEKNDIRFLLVCLEECSEMHEFFQKAGINWCVADTSEGKAMFGDAERWTCFPFDGHPNKNAHRVFAENISQACAEVLAGRFSTPRQELILIGKPAPESYEADLYPLF